MLRTAVVFRRTFGRLSSLPTIGCRSIGVLPSRRYCTPPCFAMGTSLNFSNRCLSGNSKSIVISSIRCCNAAAAIADEENGPMLKLAKAKEMLATDVDTAVDLCAEAAYDAIDHLTSELLPNVPVEEINLIRLFHVCDLQCPNQHGVVFSTYFMDTWLMCYRHGEYGRLEESDAEWLMKKFERIGRFIEAVQGIDVEILLYLKKSNCLPSLLD